MVAQAATNGPKLGEPAYGGSHVATSVARMGRPGYRRPSRHGQGSSGGIKAAGGGSSKHPGRGIGMVSRAFLSVGCQASGKTRVIWPDDLGISCPIGPGVLKV